MTTDQAEAREERVAIMTVEGMSEDDAQAYCDTKPWQFGARERNEKQLDLMHTYSTH